ncbi:hypothetical protein KJ937_01175, partial [Patescibacteria group bacterium]|nr:hypothetical protein [Patescibacteria group bacterium]
MACVVALIASIGCTVSPGEETSEEKTSYDGGKYCGTGKSCSPDGIYCDFGGQDYICKDGKFEKTKIDCAEGNVCFTPGAVCTDVCGRPLACESGQWKARSNAQPCVPDAGAGAGGAGGSGGSTPDAGELTCLEKRKDTECIDLFDGKKLCGDGELTCHCGIWMLTKNADKPCADAGAGGTGGSGGVGGAPTAVGGSGGAEPEDCAFKNKEKCDQDYDCMSVCLGDERVTCFAGKWVKGPDAEEA